MYVCMCVCIYVCMYVLYIYIYTYLANNRRLRRGSPQAPRMTTLFKRK